MHMGIPYIDEKVSTFTTVSVTVRPITVVNVEAFSSMYGT